MIEVSLSDILTGYKVLQTVTQKTLKGKINFQIARILREINNEYLIFQKSKNILIKKYADKDDGGQIKTDDNNNYLIDKTKLYDFNKELNELLETKIQLNTNYINLEDIENIDFTIEQMMALSPYIKEEQD